MTAGAGGTSAATGGTGTTGGTGVTGGAGGTVAQTGGTGGTGTAGTGGTVPAGGSGPVCKPVTQLNGSGLTLSDANISAFKYANSPAGNVTKMAYDPVGKVVVILGQDGKMYSMDPTVALPTSASNTAVTTTKPYDSGGYAANGGYGDHRGIVFDSKGTLYVLAGAGGPIGVNIKKGVLMGAGPARTWTTLVTTSAGFPNGGTNFDHNFSGIAISSDDMFLYFSSGSRTDHGETEKNVREDPLSSAVFKVPTGTMTDLSPAVMFADGTRNAFDMAFNANGDLIATDNGPDMDLPDEINFLQQGKHYGFPWRFGSTDNPTIDPAYTKAGDMRLHTGYQAVDGTASHPGGTYEADPTFPAKPATPFTDPIMNMGPDANFARADKAAAPAQVAAGLAGVTGHRSPLGIAFDVGGKLCGDYYKQGFVFSYGSVLGSALGDPGEDLLFIKLTKNADAYTMTAKQVAKGIKAPMDSVLVDNRLFSAGYGAAGQVFVFVLPTP